jgi:hypothetical protein
MGKIVPDLMMRALLLAAVLSSVGGVALADEFLVKADNPCQVTAEYEPREHMLHVRLSEDTGNGCEVPPDGLVTALDEGLTAHDDLQLIFLGRFEDYPWIAEKIVKLAAQDDRPGGAWDGGSGKARGDGGNNAYLAHLFADPRKVPFAPTAEAADVLWPIRAVLARHGYVVTGASAEKVITTRVASPVGGGKQRRLPTDALIHLRIARKG